jgi:protein O-GlcNAc transferase
LQPSDARLFSQAFQALNEGRLEDAERGFRKFLRKHSSHPGALNLYSTLLLRSGRFEEAEPIIRKAISVDSRSDVTFYNHGLALRYLGRLPEAFEAFSRSIEIKPAAPETWNNRGTVLKQLTRYDAALDDFDRAISLAPNYAEACANKGNCLFMCGRHGEALEAFDRAIAIRPDFAEAWIGKGNVLTVSDRHGDALNAFEQAARLRPDLPETWVGCGTILTNAEKPDAASAAYRNALLAYNAALKARPGQIEGWIGRGAVHAHLKQFEDALNDLDEALKRNSRHAGAWRCRGDVYYAMMRGSDALSAYTEAERLDPGFADVLVGKGNALNMLGRFDEATQAFDGALAIDPRLAGAWLGRGKSLSRNGRQQDAIAAFEKTLSLGGLRQYIAEAWMGIAKVHFELGQANDARAAFENAIETSPSYPEAWYGMGELYMVTRDYEKAIEAFKVVLENNADLRYLKGQLAYCYAMNCDWAALEPLLRDVKKDIAKGSPVAIPLVALMFGTAAAEQLVCAQTYARWAYPARGTATRSGLRGPGGRIRVAYLSADFHTHPVSELAIGVFERHDRDKFETIALSLGPDDGSAIRKRLVGAFDQFHDIRTKSNRDIAQFIADAECDIVVDLTGATYGNGSAILSWRPAPVQVTWLGYPGTSGTDFIDYILADSVVIPPDMHQFFSEKVVTLPGCYLPNDSGRLISPIEPSRAEQGLPKDGFVFGSFNSSYKIQPAVFAHWMNLLRQIEHSVLWLSPMSDASRANLIKEAERGGVAPERLVFSSRTDRPEDHLARLRLIDLFLDTPGYNGHATTCDALWAGVPVVTCIGETFAGRVAASALAAVGLPEMISGTLKEYETLALGLARDPTRLAALRNKLASNRISHLLFDTDRFARHLEAAYTAMHARAQQGGPALAIAIPSD